MRTLVLVNVVLFALACPAIAQDAPRPKSPAPGDDTTAQAPQPKVEPRPEQVELEKQFEKTMTGATLIGRFTVERPGNPGGGNRPPGEDRYHINKVTKLKGDLWMFTARVQYGQKDVTVPMPLQVKWAGDTPVITLTDMSIPGLGTYTARVLIYRDHYAGYWSGGDHGGNLWGRIEHDDQPASEAPGAPNAPKAPGAPAQPEPPK